MLTGSKLAIMWQYSPSLRTRLVTHVSKIVPIVVRSRDSTASVSSSSHFANTHPSTDANACVHTGADGGLADYIVVGAQNARKVPSNVSLEVAGMSSGTLC